MEVQVLSAAHMKKQKIIVVAGPTAVGKSSYAVKLAKRTDGEIISADSRQVYKGIDLLSGKITKKEMQGVPHYLLDIANPKKQFSVADYIKRTNSAIAEIVLRDKVPIIVGGTGFYIDAIISGNVFPEVPPNEALRKKLYSLSTIVLFEYIQKLDPARAKTVDKNNKVRLVRAIEIAKALGKVPTIKRNAKYEVEWIYLDLPDEKLKKKIHTRLLERIKKGMIREAKKLHNPPAGGGVSWKRMESLGLECRATAQFLQGKISKQEMIKGLEKDIWHYVKRQRTWFKKYGKITSKQSPTP